jgi:hypothetical protein
MKEGRCDGGVGRGRQHIDKLTRRIEGRREEGGEKSNRRNARAEKVAEDAQSAGMSACSVSEA